MPRPWHSVRLTIWTGTCRTPPGKIVVPIFPGINHLSLLEPSYLHFYLFNLFNLPILFQEYALKGQPPSWVAGISWRTGWTMNIFFLLFSLVPILHPSGTLSIACSSYRYREPSIQCYSCGGEKPSHLSRKLSKNFKWGPKQTKPKTQTYLLSGRNSSLMRKQTRSSSTPLEHWGWLAIPGQEVLTVLAGWMTNNIQESWNLAHKSRITHNDDPSTSKDFVTPPNLSPNKVSHTKQILRVGKESLN